MVRDPTGRFSERPYYEAPEVDREFEVVVTSFLQMRLGGLRFPVSTDEISILIEQAGASLDSSVDLSDRGDDIEGVTLFVPDRPPEVMISNRLAGSSNRETRHRMTLAHEYAHVRLHGPLFEKKFAIAREQGNVLGPEVLVGREGRMLLPPDADWMEWQAGYGGGALLMPATPTRRVVADYCHPLGLHSTVPLSSPHAMSIIAAVAEMFFVSRDASRVRLLKLGLLGEDSDQLGLF